MASNSTISIAVKLVDGKDGLKELTFTAKDLRKAMKGVLTESDKLNRKFINFAAVATGVDSLKAGIDSIRSTLSDLTGAYSKQIEVETLLANNMRNSIETLCGSLL